MSFRDAASDQTYQRPLTPTIATDGAGSAVRASLAAAQAISVHEEPLGHDYKELTIPARDGRHALDAAALHIWPRGGFMLIALPNVGGSFTATLFLPRAGATSFAALSTRERIAEFCAREFPDVVALMPDLIQEFMQHPLGYLGTVHSAPWHVAGRVLLMGDAAHAIFPFHGQGMNAAFEDCLALDELLEECADWQSLFARFEERRRPNAEAIAQMSLENYQEMRATVLDPAFKRQQELSFELEERFPDRFIRRYSMVMFHPEISYAEALRRGQVQNEIIAQIARHPGCAASAHRDAAAANPLKRALAARASRERAEGHGVRMVGVGRVCALLQLVPFIDRELGKVRVAGYGRVDVREIDALGERQEKLEKVRAADDNELRSVARLRQRVLQIVHHRSARQPASRDCVSARGSCGRAARARSTQTSAGPSASAYPASAP